MVRFIVSLALLVLLGTGLSGAFSGGSNVLVGNTPCFASDPMDPIYPPPPPPPRC